MSGCCPSCYESNSPEIVPVTVNQTVVQIGDAPAMHRTQTFTFTAPGAGGIGDDSRSLLLTYFPYEARSVEVYLNSGAQRYGIDFTVQGQYVVMATALVAGDAVHVRYLHVDGVVASQATSVGAIVTSAGTELDGFLRMDGTTSHNWVDYPQLAAWFGDTTVTAGPSTLGADRLAALVLTDTGTGGPPYTGGAFTLKAFYDTTYNGSEFVTLNKFLCHGQGVS